MTDKKLAEETCECSHCSCNSGKKYGGDGGGAIYAIGIFGAAYYFFPQASDLGGYAIALLKSLGWPAMVVYQALSLLKL